MGGRGGWTQWNIFFPFLSIQQPPGVCLSVFEGHRSPSCLEHFFSCCHVSDATFSPKIEHQMKNWMRLKQGQKFSLV